MCNECNDAIPVRRLSPPKEGRIWELRCKAAFAQQRKEQMYGERAATSAGGRNQGETFGRRRG
jgi:hypothetical protein